MKKHISSILACCLLVFLAGSTALAQKTAEDFYKLSEQRVKNRDLDGALAALNKAIELKPDFAALYPKRSELHLMKGEMDAALADLDKGLLLDSEMTEAYAARGGLRLMTGNMKGALSDLDNAIARGDRTDRNYGMRGNAKLILNDATGALADFNTAISMNGNGPGNYLGRAAARSQLEDEAGALADYTSVIDAFEQKEREGTAPDEATRKVRANDMNSPMIAGPVKTKPGDSKVTTTTQLLVTMNPEAEATMTAEEMEYLPNVAGAYSNRAQMHSKKGDFEAAMADINKAIAIYPDFGSYSTRGRIWKERGDLKSALADFSKSLELQPQNAFNYVGRAEVFMLMGKDAEAEKDYKRCLELDPGLAATVTSNRAAAKKQLEGKP